MYYQGITACKFATTARPEIFSIHKMLNHKKTGQFLPGYGIHRSHQKTIDEAVFFQHRFHGPFELL